MEDMRHTEALGKLFEIMEGRYDIKEVKFDRKMIHLKLLAIRAYIFAMVVNLETK